MRFSALLSRRFIFLALLALAVGCPYAIPVPWLAITRWATGSVVENPGFLTSPVDNQSWFVVFGAVCAGWAAILYHRRRDGGMPDEPDRLLRRLVFTTGSAWFAITLVRGVLAPQFQSMYHDLLLQTAFFVLFVVAALRKTEGRDLRVFTITLTAGVIPLAVIALMQNAGADPLAYSAVVPGTLEIIKGKQLISSTFGHPNYMGSYLAPVVVMAIGLAMFRAHWIWRGLGAASAVMSMLALVAGGTRGPLLAVMAGLLVFWMMNRGAGTAWSRRRVLRTSAAALAASIILALGLWMIPALRPSFNLLDRLFAGKEVASRAFYWLVGLEMFKDAPFFGIGLGQFDSQFWWTLSRMPEIEPGGPWHFMVNSIVRGVRPGNMHNDHLQVLVESGLVGALAWVGLWAAVGMRGWSMRVRAIEARAVVNCNFNAAFMGAFAAVGVDALFGFPFHLPCSGALFWVALGLWAGDNRASERNLTNDVVGRRPGGASLQ